MEYWALYNGHGQKFYSVEIDVPRELDHAHKFTYIKGYLDAITKTRSLPLGKWKLEKVV